MSNIAAQWRAELRHLQKVANDDGYHEVIRQHARWKAAKIHNYLDDAPRRDRGDA
jgi:hypothetical protein